MCSERKSYSTLRIETWLGLWKVALKRTDERDCLFYSWELFPWDLYSAAGLTWCLEFAVNFTTAVIQLFRSFIRSSRFISNPLETLSPVPSGCQVRTNIINQYLYPPCPRQILISCWWPVVDTDPQSHIHIFIPHPLPSTHDTARETSHMSSSAGTFPWNWDN